jgi:subtilase-type serine protease
MILQDSPLRPLPLVLALQLVLASNAWAGSFSVPANSTDSSTKTLTSGDTGNIANSASLTGNSSTPNINVTGTSGTVTINNDGDLSNSSSGRAIENNTNGVAITLNNNGSISTISSDALRLNKANSTLILNNNGSIRVTGNGTSGGQALDLRSASGTAAKLINNGSNSNHSALIESHNDDALRPGTNTTINNYGSILSSGSVNTKCPSYLGTACSDAPSAHDAIDAGSLSGLAVNNWGSISGARHGITADPDLTVTNQLGGLIIGRNGSGVGSDGIGTVINYGTISGAYAGAGQAYDHLGDGSTANNGDGDGVDIDGIGTITNYGRIEGLGAGGFDSGGAPNGADGIAAGGGSIINHAGAVISGQSKGILIDDGANGTSVASGRGTDTAAAGVVTISNAGSIIGVEKTAIGLVGNFDDSLTNLAGGVISGGANSVRVDELLSSTAAAAVQMGAGNDSLSNAGLIEGKNGLAVDLGSGDDSLTLYSSARFSGLVDGGSGNDRVLLDDSAGGSFGNSANFERLEVRQGAWTLSSNDFSSSAQVFSGASLFNTGRIGGNLLVDSGARYSGGQVDGNLTLASGSILVSNITDDGQYNPVSITGSASLAGANLQVNASNGNYALLNHYNILQADGGINGQFATVSSNLAFLVPTLSYSANTVQLNLTRNDLTLADLANNANSRAAANSLQGQGSGTLHDTLLGSSSNSVSNGLEQLSASNNASLSTISLASNAQVGSAMLGAMQSVSGTSLQTSLLRDDGPQLAALDVLPSARNLNDPQSAGRLWMRGLSGHGQVDGQHGASNVSQNTDGGLLGADWSLTPSWRLGLLGGYAKSRIDAGSNASGHITSSHAGVYAQHQDGPLTLRLGASYSSQDGESKRNVAFSGFSDRLRGNYDANTQQAFSELGYQMGEARLLLEPFVSLGYQRYSRDSYDEKGGAAALHVDAQEQDNLSNTLGIRLASLRTLDNGLNMTPRLNLAWRHTYGDLNSSTRQAFLTGGSAFSVEGSALDRNSLLLEAGLDFGITAAQSIGVAYSGEKGSQTQVHAVIAQWQLTF